VKDAEAPGRRTFSEGRKLPSVSLYAPVHLGKVEPGDPRRGSRSFRYGGLHEKGAISPHLPGLETSANPALGAVRGHHHRGEVAAAARLHLHSGGYPAEGADSFILTNLDALTGGKIMEPSVEEGTLQ
jgi:hypothetical protein